MNDETDKPDDKSVSQEEIDQMIEDTQSQAGSGSGEPHDMDYNEIESSLTEDDDEQEFDLGEPMAADVTAIYDIPVQISAVLGRSTMQVSQLLFTSSHQGSCSIAT